MLKIGITGGIGAGKSVVCRIFQALGAPVYDADTRAKWLIAHDAELKAQIAARFGEAAYLPDGAPDRRYLAQRVFAQETERLALNALVHPRVGADTRAWLQSLPATVPYALKEAALLIETGGHRELDGLVVVTAPDETRLARVLARDPQRSREEVLAIMAKQMPEAEKIALAQWVIHNDGQQMLIPQVLALHRRFIGQAV
ncbi:MAG: dephospho-CoA kinase [Bernardetiaceae bacterium]|jgi:dephospho-CoA kinase|nr:dephospho-CoA kinase [Bernardetiaceae bacterium]